ncbi:cache domain-containing protein [Pseudodesulfovibrio senegalensis]|uniref:Cache domain-containing protein n=1 Tax=Pseudodesulfovibrio senegalensis TaxID=1721087 RepID=A0A6N6N345_9BACT|nr:cache domain-containing protein [Pseudodesulfovibrio senegalensis]KAB1442233.1 hypothetical protein F8A88_07185 [Pseudodesulfovibrio senegalensis]
MRKTMVFVFALICFGVSGCQDDDRNRQVDQAHAHLRLVAAHIGEAFAPMRLDIRSLADHARQLYAAHKPAIPPAARKQYAQAPNGVFYKKTRDGKPSLFISALNPITQAAKDMGYLTECLDSALMNACSHPSVIQAYYNTRQNICRIYPPVDVLTQFDPHTDIPGFAFYYEADIIHNPGKGPVWLAHPYVDPAGRGWIVSLICPVYAHDRLQGVVGLDIAVATMAKTFPTLQDKSVLMIDDAGGIITGNEAMTSLLSMPPVTKEKYLRSITDNTARPDGHSLLQSRSRDVRAMTEKILNHGADRASITIRGKDYTAIAARIPEPGWTIIRMMD